MISSKPNNVNINLNLYNTIDIFLILFHVKNKESNWIIRRHKQP